MLDEQRVPLAAGRVGRRHVEGLEVVPVGLDLGPFGDLEAEADEHVLEPLGGLGDEVGVAAPGSGQRLGQVEALGRQLQRGGRSAASSARRASRAACTSTMASLTARPAVASLLGRERAQAGLGPGQRPPLAEHLGLDRPERRRGRSAAATRGQGVGPGPGERRRSSGQ